MNSNNEWMSKNSIGLISIKEWRIHSKRVKRGKTEKKEERNENEEIDEEFPDTNSAIVTV